MVAATAILVTIATSLATGLLKEVCKKAANAVSQSSTFAGHTSAIFGGLQLKLRQIENELKKLEAVVCQAQNIDPMQCNKNDLVLLWLKKVKEVAWCADNLFDEITYEKIRRRVPNRRRICFRRLTFRLRIGRKSKECLRMIAEIHKEAETTLKLAELVEKAPIYHQPTTATSRDLSELRENPDTSIVIGRKADEDLIVSELCGLNNGNQFSVVAIVGASGVGKTTLARMVYDNKSVVEQFAKTWIFVSDNFELKRFLGEMIQSVTKKRHKLSNISAMEDKLQEYLQKEKKEYLLVLDDVWNADEQLWKSVESSLVRVTRSTRCRVLVTTQIPDVARKMRASVIHVLENLSDADAWSLFKEIAFANKTQEQVTNLEDVGRRILSKCSGLPLAIKSFGNLLGSMNEKSKWESVERSELWDLSLPSNLIPWQLVSFHHLPNAEIKQCFDHCSIIIEKHSSVHQSELIQGWMAQGFISSTGDSGTSMEQVGETYLRTLVAHGLLQMDDDSDGCFFWMRDIVHDLAFFISKDTSMIARKACDLQNADNVEHLRICGEDASKSQYDLRNDKTLSKLRTLICTQATLSKNFATQATHVRDLRLIDCGLEEVPSSVGRLKHLRYLCLSGNPFRCLPESMGALFNLQTLDLQQCFQLVELPREITMLVNLRHILTSDIVKMPKGMGQLTCLRTMPGINLREKEGFEIKEFGSLQFLSGEIVIAGLEHISRKEDVTEASLKTKPGITCLRLQWSNERQEACPVSNDEEIMDGLYPHSKLEEISLANFGGKRFSSWLHDMNNLKLMDLYACRRCEQLPALGQLSSLEEISIDEMDSLQVIGIEFYHGRAAASFSADSSMTDKSRRVLFPRLKILRLRNIPKLGEWVQPESSTYEAFPCLTELEIADCPLLVRVPTCFHSLLSLSISNIVSGEALMMIVLNNTNLTALDISGVEKLTSLSQVLLKCTSVETVCISDCVELSELCPTTTLQHLGSLASLQVERCNSLTSFPNIQGLSSLRNLGICECNNLSTIPGLESCISLETLELKRNAKLDLIPDLTKLSGLTWLTVIGFSSQMSIPGWLSHLVSLRYLRIGGFNEELDELASVKHLPKCLKDLDLYGWPKLNSLPSELQFFNELESLGIQKFGGMEALPEWLGDLSSLQDLFIGDCEKLKHLPSLDSMRRLTHLLKLEISNCPLLNERCRKDGGEEWDKISHISIFNIY